MTDSPLTLSRRDDGVAVLALDGPGTDVNLLTEALETAFQQALDEIEQDATIRAVVLASDKPDSFLAGADVGMVRRVDTADEAERLARSAQAVMNRVAAFPRPIVAAIHGACLGGGLELALACRARIASDHDKTRLGLPEVQLGLIPGAGGTQRLPRQVGLEEALGMILAGKRIPAGKAKAIGLVDEIVHEAILRDVAAEQALRLANSPAKRGVAGRARDALEALGDVDFKALLLEDNPAGRAVLFSQARKRTLARTHGHMPAPLRALDVIRTGIEDGLDAGLDAEAKAFGELACTREAQHLMGLFLASEQLKAERGADAAPLAVRKVGILGAGLMGSGIAFVTAANAEVPVRLKDLDHTKLRDGLRIVHEAVETRGSKKRLSEFATKKIRQRVRPTTDLTGFAHVDVVIEAVVEDLDVKHQVLREVEAAGPEHLIFASNTSSLPIARIAEASARPEQVIGMHYFSPVDKVPLLEIIVTDETAPWVTATCVKLGKEQGKTVIVVNDGTGFYTSRILGPYLAEAAHLLREDVPAERIDRALTRYGFPIGPIRLLDEVGIDVAHKIAAVLRDAYGERMATADVTQRLVDDDRQGKKNGRGFYRYEEQPDGSFARVGDEIDETVYEAVGVEPTQEADDDADIALRCVLAMVNEAVRCYEDGILRSARDGDVGAVFGLGFPPFRGGPFCFVDQHGAGRVLARLERYREALGDRFAPAGLLRTLADRDTAFYADNAPPPGRSA